MNKKTKVSLLIGIIVIFCLSGVVYGVSQSHKQKLEEKNAINHIVLRGMDDGNIPGVAVGIIDKEGTHTYTYGYDDIKKKTRIKEDSLFQLASNSKAYTAYAVCKLAEEGKIDLDKPVSHYVDGFYMNYKANHSGKTEDEKTEITVRQLLNHVSGIAQSDFAKLEPQSTEDALETSMYSFVGKTLKHYPGNLFEYSNINYDLLGLLIEKVSGVSYEEYMQQQVFKPLGLENTYVETDKQLVTGYKHGFSLSGVQLYDAPEYKENVPAGYVISDIRDMEKWLSYQMNPDSLPKTEAKSMLETQNANRKNPTQEISAYYAAGWYVKETPDGTLVYHSGNNPNYSSFVIFNKELQVGVTIIANLNSSYVSYMGMQILSSYMDEIYQYPVKDTFQTLNGIMCMVIIISSILSVFAALLLAERIRRIIILKEKPVRPTGKQIKHIILVGIIVSILFYAAYKMPCMIYPDADWDFAKVWLPGTVLTGCKLLLTAIGLFYIDYIISVWFKGQKKRHYVLIALLSIISGLGNSAIIFVVNSAIVDYHFQKNLFTYFAIGMLLYLLGQSIVRIDLVEITADIIYSKRKAMITKILDMNYDDFEQIEQGQIQACINNDTEVLSGMANVLISGVTSLVTIICCCFYLYLVSKEGFLLTLGIILIAAMFYYSIMSVATKYLEEARNCQSRLHKFIMDMLLGFRELNISKRRRTEFTEDIIGNCQDYKEKQEGSGKRFAFVYVIGESLFTLVIGIIVFLFPLLLSSKQSSSLQEYVLVLLYITGPINYILNSIPQLIQMKISWNRLNALEEVLKIKKNGVDDSFGVMEPFEKLSVQQVCYKYKGDNDAFSVGPVCAEFKKGQISFIIGENGSGKSTFINLITSLYAPISGQILMNGHEISREALGELYSTVYSGFYLFDKIYGVDLKKKMDSAKNLLKTLKLEKKVTIEEDRFSTIDLSTGQKKRLALLLSYLEDKPVYIFDEWAADQDPSFREIFYCEILPKLKESGKCIIAITHDNKYFHMADQVLKFNFGKMEYNK